MPCMCLIGCTWLWMLSLHASHKHFCSTCMGHACACACNMHVELDAAASGAAHPLSTLSPRNMMCVACACVPLKMPANSVAMYLQVRQATNISSQPSATAAALNLDAKPQTVCRQCARCDINETCTHPNIRLQTAWIIRVKDLSIIF